MGKVYSSLILRPLRNYNAEIKAHKIIDATIKPKVAPRYESEKQHIDTYVKENEEVLKTEIKNKNEDLHQRLKGMVVDVEKPGIIQNKEQSSRKLPGIRTKPTISEFGYVEPDVVKEGHVSIKQTIEFLSKHHSEPTKYKEEDIAKDYEITVEDATKILTYFKVFQVYIPKRKDKSITGKIFTSLQDIPNAKLPSISDTNQQK